MKIYGAHIVAVAAMLECIKSHDRESDVSPTTAMAYSASALASASDTRDAVFDERRLEAFDTKEDEDRGPRFGENLVVDLAKGIERLTDSVHPPMLETPLAASIGRVTSTWHEGVGNIYVPRDWKGSQELSADTRQKWLNDEPSYHLRTALADPSALENPSTKDLVAKYVAQYKTSRVVECAIGLVSSGKKSDVKFGIKMLEILLQAWWQEGKALDYVFEQLGLRSHSLDFKRLTVLELCIELWNEEEHGNFELVEVLIRYYGDSWLSFFLSDAILHSNVNEREKATHLQTKMMQDWKKRGLSAENVYNMLELGSVRGTFHSKVDRTTYEKYDAFRKAEKTEKVSDAIKTKNGRNKMKRLKEEMRVKKRKSIDKRKSVNKRKSKHPRIE
uniref:Uncharacterized protein n=1 Tax=Peronospora matthiolae TaxID=2874970 RepID=A0AAV1UA56_9STRA